MADPHHLQRLVDCLVKPAGRKEWVEFKLKARWIDLSTADFTDKSLAHYDLSEVNLSSSIFLDADLTGADLSDAQLTYADLRRARLRNACLDRADLSGANLQGAELTDACLEHARLARCRMMEAHLVGCDLSNADLTGADLRGAVLKYARLTGAKLAGANVAGADLTGVVMDDDAPVHLMHFDQAYIDDRRYRELRSRVAASRPAAEPPAAAVPAPVPTEPPRPAGREGKPKRKARLRVRPSAPPTAAESVRFEEGIPIRDREPDLSSTEACYRILELPPGASTEEIAKAFRAKAKLYHPDKTRHLSERLQQLASVEFQRVFKAYEYLTRRTTRPLVGIRWAEGVMRRASPYEYSIDDYEKLARVNPRHPDILYNLAWKYFEAGLYQQSIEGFQRVLEIDPSDEDAVYNLMIARLFVELGLPAPL